MRASSRTSRRRFLQLVAGTGVASRALAGGFAPQPARHRGVAASIADELLRLEFDSELRCRALRVRRDAPPLPLTAWAATESLLLGSGAALELFTLRRKEEEAVDGAHGPGTRLTLTGGSAGVEKRVQIELYQRYPGFACYHVSYRNLSDRPVALGGWRSHDLRLLPGRSAPGVRGRATEPEFWSYCGSTHEDRRDWVQPVKPGFAQENFMGMTASDYGGGTPIIDVWRRDCGLALGHLEKSPRLLSLPVRRAGKTAALAVSARLDRSLAAGEALVLPETFIATHEGDHFATLDTYRRLMGERGFVFPRPPTAAYEGVWCAWGYERACTPQLIVD
ncbi:MAG: alpha-galactosidase, partial [Gammaproteobacteria bacterium]|nr:alpha-galactosidase [Gammaproteobacteria bacterium]